MKIMWLCSDCQNTYAPPLTSTSPGMVVPMEEDESSKGQGVREAEEEEEEEGLKGEEEETEVLEKSKVSFKYIVCLSLKEVNMIERKQLTVA